MTARTNCKTVKQSEVAKIDPGAVDAALNEIQRPGTWMPERGRRWRPDDRALDARVTAKWGSLLQRRCLILGNGIAPFL